MSAMQGDTLQYRDHADPIVLDAYTLAKLCDVDLGLGLNQEAIDLLSPVVGGTGKR